jgi:hypothetical protein
MISIQQKYLNACMAGYFDCDEDNLPQGRWEWMDGVRRRVWPMRRVLRARGKAGTWGWIENKDVLHLWIADHANRGAIVRLITHELGHAQKSINKEESKAERYACVALTAYEIMEEIKGR